MTDKIWKFQEINETLVEQVMSYRQIPEIIAKLLVIRGITTKEGVEAFYHVSREGFHDPLLLTDMAVAIKRVLQARDREEKIVVYGDYDVDGVTSTSILTMFLNECGCHVDAYIPDRHEEGYGINTEAIQQIVAEGARLMISVDTGITAVEQVDIANELGLDVIITDHHECQEKLPRALGVINPKRDKDLYPFKQLAGVGVTFKLIQGIARTIGLENLIWKYLDIVAIGTVADIVPLCGENRTIAKLAFASIPTTWNQGLRALMKVSDIEGKKMTAGRIGFGIGPRLNAAGRIRHAMEGVELFVNPDPEVCRSIAESLNQVNQERQNLEKKIYKEAVDLIESTMDPSDKHIIVVSSEQWHHGVIGIVASKLVERYYRPVVILAIEDGIASGSARSVEGFSIFDALMSCKELFMKVGGHEMAAGMSLDVANIIRLDEALNFFGQKHMGPDLRTPKVKVDFILSLEEVTIPLIEAIMEMEPFGIGNREPCFYIKDQVGSVRRIGKDLSHLKVELGTTIKKQGIGFSLGDLSEWVKEGQEAECVCQLDINEWQNKRSPQLMIKDIRPTLKLRQSIEAQLKKHQQSDYLDEAYQATFALTREDYGRLYRHLKVLDESKIWHMTYTDVIHKMVKNEDTRLIEVLVMLEVLSELGILTYELQDHFLSFQLLEGKKVALEVSKLYNKFLL